jgi:hypothetical protein
MLQQAAAIALPFEFDVVRCLSLERFAILSSERERRELSRQLTNTIYASR